MTVPQKRLSCGERRNQIIQVAMDLFATKGFKGATTRAIASAAGVSEAIIFRHFKTKEDLYDAIITTCIERRNEVWDREAPSIAETDDLEVLMKAFATGFIKRHREDQTFIRLMLYSALQDHKFRQRFFESGRSPYMRRIRERIQNGVTSGEYIDIDPGLTMSSFFSSLLQYAVNRFVGSSESRPPEADDAYIENLVKLYVCSLKPQASNDAALSL
jgi:AcrR family transcriptional regulator